MKLDAITHIPMSQYAHGLDDEHIVFRLRCAKGDLTRCTLYSGDTACRVTPIIFTPAEMHVAASDMLHDYWEIVLKSPYRRLFYYFDISDGKESVLYYGDVFTDKLVDDRSEYFKLPFNHRADIARVPDWVNDAIVYNIFPDSFATSREYISCEPSEHSYGDNICRGKLGGTVKGITENISYLSALGINCIYINPLFTAGEYHKYDLLDYFHVDPCFGTDEDFAQMVQKLHQAGIRVIIDGVFNHCGWHFFAFEDVVRNGENSGYKDWFYGLRFPVVRPVDPEDYPTYECFGYERMMPKLDTANDEVREYFCHVGRYWVEKYDIDGWRLDVASEVDDRFWRKFRREVKSIKPDALLIGEVWESAGHWLDGTMFDSAMNYDFRKHCRRFFAEGSMSAEEFSGRITDMLMRYRRQITPAQLNLLDSHDVSRFLSLCVGDERRYKLAVLFMMCFVGMPTVFYGDELGITGVLEKDYRAPMPWNGGDSELASFFRNVIALRREHIALRRGEYRLYHAEGKLLVFERRHEAETVLVAINAGDRPVQFCKGGTVLSAYGYDANAIAPFGWVVLAIH